MNPDTDKSSDYLNMSGVHYSGLGFGLETMFEIGYDY